MVSQRSPRRLIRRPDPFPACRRPLGAAFRRPEGMVARLLICYSTLKTEIIPPGSLPWFWTWLRMWQWKTQVPGFFASTSRS